MRASKNIAVLVILFATYLLFIENSSGYELINANELLPEGWKIRSVRMEDSPYGYVREKDHLGIRIYLTGTTEIEAKKNFYTTENITLWFMPLEYKGKPLPPLSTPQMEARFIGKTTKYKLFAKVTYKLPTWQNWKDDLIKYYKIEKIESIFEENNRLIVLEMIYNLTMLYYMPEPEVITFKEYIKTKEKYILKMLDYKHGDALKYEEKSGDKPGSYWLTLESFNDKWVWIAELRQNKSKGWDWIERYQIKRDSQVEEEFQISNIIKERAQTIGGVKDGMTRGEVISIKGEPKKINIPQGGWAVDLIYDDIIVHIRQWPSGNSATGRVVSISKINN